MTAHTPGPWIVEDREVFGPSPYGTLLPNSTGRMVIARPAPHGNEHANQSRANAHLIAAAPDLLAALLAVDVAVTCHDSQGGNLEATIEKANPQTMVAVRTAIAKARGTRSESNG